MKYVLLFVQNSFNIMKYWLLYTVLRKIINKFCLKDNFYVINPLETLNKRLKWPIIFFKVIWQNIQIITKFDLIYFCSTMKNSKNEHKWNMVVVIVLLKNWVKNNHFTPLSFGLKYIQIIFSQFLLPRIIIIIIIIHISV